jgi:hypothetical protein
MSDGVSGTEKSFEKYEVNLFKLQEGAMDAGFTIGDLLRQALPSARRVLVSGVSMA